MHGRQRDRQRIGARAGGATALAAGVIVVHGWLLAGAPSGLGLLAGAPSGLGPPPPGARPALTLLPSRSTATAPLAEAVVPLPHERRVPTTSRAAVADAARAPRAPTEPERAAKATAAALAPVDPVAPPPRAEIEPQSATALAIDGDAEPAAAPAGVATAAPVYRTRIPAPMQLSYEIERGDARGQARLEWRAHAGGYELLWLAQMPGGRRIEQRSEGRFDDAGLAPERLSDRRTRRGTASARFDRAQQRVTFSGPRWEYPLQPGVQDRLSWLVQLTAIAAAEGLQPGAEIVLQVVGARGAWARWHFVAAGFETIDGPRGSPERALRLVREPAHPYDVRLEVWLAPALGWWPLQLQQAQLPGGVPTRWRLTDEASTPPGS